MSKAGFFIQLKALLKRNLILKRRNQSQTIQEFLIPVLFVLLLALLVVAKPDVKILPPVPQENLTAEALIIYDQKILATPNSTVVQELMNEIIKDTHGSEADYMLFDTERDMIEYYIKLPEEKALELNGLTFNNLQQQSVDYTIRTPAKSLPSLKEEFDVPERCRPLDNRYYQGPCKAAMYRDSGFLQLQILVNTAISRVIGNATDLTLPTVSIQFLPMFEFKPNIRAIRGMTAVILIFAYSPIINFLLINLVAEKEKKIRETMRIMGTIDSAYWFSWSIIYGVIISIISIVSTVIIKLTGILRYSDGILLFLLLLFYGITIMHLAFALMPLFKKANVAGTVGMLVTLVVGCLYLPINLTSTTTITGMPQTTISAAWQWVLCLLSPIALGLVVDKAQLLEVTHRGLKFDTLGVGDFPAYGPLIMLILDCILYGFIAWYLERIVPGEFGPRQSAFFCFSKNYWMPSKKPRENVESDYLVTNAHGPNTAAAVYNAKDDVEDVSPELKGKEAIRIFGATKKFKKVTAVDDLSLDIYEGHITCLLGHNGAGKTTLVNMLTGVMHPSSGTAMIYGYDISDPNEVLLMRSMIGLCPQENCLFDTLSCTEHLEVYASIKGVPASDVQQKVQRSLQDVGLGDKAHAFAKDLSGGQKRKLSVAIALIGDPKVVFLDEPSAGLDPSSRRHLWSLLKSSKKDRVIVLTTHFMDEADLLADRKAFISKGRLKCCGSSLFLKNRFGIGYHLTMVVDDNADVNRITNEVTSHIAKAKYVRRYGQELLFTLPFDDVGNFAGLFAKFESKSTSGDQVDFSTSLGIQSYGVSMSSLEEVFMKLEEAEETAEPEEDDTSHLKDIITDIQKILPDIRFSEKRAEARDVLEHSPAVLGDEPEAVELKQLGKRPEMPQFDDEGTNTEFDRFIALGKLRIWQICRNKKNIFYRILLPALFILLGAVFPKFIKKSDPSSDLQHRVMPYMYARNPQDQSLPSLAFQNFTGANIDDIVKTIRNQDLEINMLDTDANFSKIAPHLIGVKVHEFEGKAGNYSINYTALYNDTMVHSAPAIIEIIGNTLYQLVTGKQWKIEATAMMWPDPKSKTYQYNGGTIMTVFLWGLAMVIIPPGFCGEVAQDRVTKARSQLRISGVRWATYWGTIFLTHMAQFCVCTLLTVIIALIIQADSLKSPGALGCLVLLYVIYMPTLTLFSYLLSFPFKKHETALTVVSNVFLAAAVIPFIIVLMLKILQSRADTVVHVIFCFIDPPYAMYGALIFLEMTYLASVTRNLAVHASSEPPSLTLAEYLKWENNIQIIVIAGIVQLITFSILLVVVDIHSTGGSIVDVLPFMKKKVAMRPADNQDVPLLEDSDVKSEREKVNSIPAESAEKPPIVLNNVRKMYKKRQPGYCSCCRGLIPLKSPAVRNVSFAVEKGEVFGLLGPNGAGKTTTLNMILAETAPDTGRVFVGGHDIRSSLSEAYQALGYCPQHDPLWDDVTLEEHIQCYAAVRGIPNDHIEPLTKYFLESLKLGDHAKKTAKTLSGGTKRKLCYILSMLGNPQIVLMDEPSTGMDPKSKRFLWNTISDTFAGSNKGAILTTHYMDEADVLCSRVGIMVNGLLQCIGSTQHLKGKFGSGYILELKVDASIPTKLEELKAQVNGFVMEHFPHAVLMEGFGNRSTYKILKDDIHSLASVFAALEDAKTTMNIEEYSFSQSTLEQVFLNFAKTQQILDEDPNAMNTVTSVAV